MLKLSRNGIGVLTSQYRSVLKKCAFMNMIAAGFLLFAPHMSAAAEPGTNIASLENMGTTISNEAEYNVLYVTGEDGNNIKELFSTVGHELGWIYNFNEVYLGQEIIGGVATHVDTEISNKHSTPITDSTSDLTPAQGGGVLGNKEGSTLIDQVVFKNNSVTEFNLIKLGSIHSISAGGVLSNTAGPTGRVDIQDSTFINNYTMQFVDASGGAIYNSTQSDDDGEPGKIYSTRNTFSYNHVGNEDMAASDYDVVKAGVTADVTENITDVWQAKARTLDPEKYPDGASDAAYGGAVYNGGYYVMSFDNFDHNYAVGQNAYGGALYNSLYGYYSDIGEDIGVMIVNGTNTFESNHSESINNGNAYGGAIYNGGTITFDTYSATELTFENNYVVSQIGDACGGAVANTKANAFDIINPVIHTLHNALFESNYAKGFQAKGGAIYNGGEIELIDATFNNNSIQKISSSQSVAYGGAIYNAGLITVANDENSRLIEFNNNHSELYGGAVFNYIDGIVEGEIETTMRFSGNTDELTSNEGALITETPSTGGAIYGSSGSVVNLTLADQGKIVFEKYAKDNVFMNKASGETSTGGLFKVTGDNNDASALRGNSVRASSIDPTKTMISLGSSFTGEGRYVIENTQLNLVDGAVADADDVAGTGYIGFTPQMELTNVVVNMAGTMGSSASGQAGGKANSGGFMYLSSNNDSLVDNDFYITNPNAVLYYSDYDSTYNGFAVGNYIDNSGLIVYDDKPENGITRSVYEDLTTDGDTDIKIADTLVNSGVVNTALDKFITQNIHIGTLDSKDGSIFINMDNAASHLITADSEHKLIPEAPEGYDFGTYAGEHYASEVIYIDDTVSGTTKITLVDMDNINYTQVNLDEGQRIYFARTQLAQGLDGFTWNVENAVNDDYEIKIGYDDNGTVYDWFLYRVSEPGPTPPPPPPPTPGLDPEDMVALSLPRASLEQLRSLRLPIDRTNRGQCSCYKDNCDNSFCQYEPGSPKTRIWATPFYRQGTFERPFDVDFKLLGVDFGLDFQPTNSDLIGVFGSYRFGKYNNDGNQKHYGDETKYFSDKGGELEIKSLVGGAYYRKYIKDLYLLGAVFAGKIDADIKADNGVKGSVDGKTLGAELEIGYDIKTTRRSTVTPSVRGTYNYIKFDKGHTTSDKKISVGKINSFEIEAALKMEYQFNNSNQLPTTGYIKPSVIQMIPDGGKVKIDDKEYKKTLDNETLGRIEIGADTNLTTGFSVGVFGNYTFGSHYDAWGVGGNIKYVF